MDTPLERCLERWRLLVALAMGLLLPSRVGPSRRLLSRSHVDGLVFDAFSGRRRSSASLAPSRRTGPSDPLAGARGRPAPARRAWAGGRLCFRRVGSSASLRRLLDDVVSTRCTKNCVLCVPSTIMKFQTPFVVNAILYSYSRVRERVRRQLSLMDLTIGPMLCVLTKIVALFSCEIYLLSQDRGRR